MSSGTDNDTGTTSDTPDTPVAPVRRLRRGERREQILAAATRAFARTGFAGTSLDDIAAEAQISRVILYRHFDSKADLYHGVLNRAGDRLAATVGIDRFDESSIPALVRGAAADPDGFRLLFRHAATEPEFRGCIAAFTTDSVEIAHRHTKVIVPEPAWALWAASLARTVAIEGVLAWLDSGDSDSDTAAAAIAQAVGGVIDAARAAGQRDGQATER